MRLPRSTKRLPPKLVPAILLCLLTLLPLRVRAAANELELSPTSLPYGNVKVGLTRTVSLAVTNHGKSSVTISGIDSSDSMFKVSPLKLPKILAAGEKLELSVTFEPTAPGWVGGHVTVVSSATDRVLTLEVAGTGVKGEVTASPASLSFGDVNLGQSSTSHVVLSNASPTKVTLQSMKITGSAFSVSGAKFPLSLARGETVKLDVTFKPKAKGTTYGSFLITGPALNIPLAGTGTVPSERSLAVVPATLSFGNVGVGTTKTLTLGLDATGEAVTISSVSSSSSQFTVLGVEFPLTIPAGHELSLNVTFKPQNNGNKSATLSFASNAGNSPSSEPLKGSGTALYVTLSWNPSTSQVSGYNVFRSTSPTGALTKLNSELDPETAYTDATIVGGKTYYYATTAVSSTGRQSAYSNRVEVVVP